MIPEATLCHFTKGRLRLKIGGRREDHEYFLSVREKLRKAGFSQNRVNPLTGSVVILKKGISVEEISDFGKKNKLFAMAEEEKKGSGNGNIVQKITTPIYEINADLKKISGGNIDLPIAIFILLLAFGVIEILRGNFKLPPWYTAFWYAFGVFSRSIFDSSQKDVG